MYFDIALIIIALIITIVLLRRSVNIGYVMLIDTIFVIIGQKMSANDIFTSLFKACFSSKTIGLLIVLNFILIIENIMRNTGMIRNVVLSIKGLLKSQRISAFFLPALIGLLPSPGGARFSCPMVEEVITDKSQGSRKAFINYWFRHIWLDAFILYPAIILASEVLEVHLITMFLHMIPFMIVHILIGVLFDKFGKNGSYLNERIDAKPSGDLLKNAFPIIFIIITYIILSRIPSFSFELQIASFLTVVLLLVTKKYSRKETAKMVKESVKLKFTLMILGVMVFDQFLKDSGLLGSWVETITYYNIPKELLFVLIPFVTGFSSGIALSFVTLSFPILLHFGLAQDSIWHVAAAYTAGFAGVMMSPLHLCGVMSSDYFGVQTKSLLKRVIKAELIMLCVVIIVLYIGK